VWTWTAICADIKIVPSWLVGERTAEDAEVFIRDLASRLANGIQLTTDGLRLYVHAVENVFHGDIDYASSTRSMRPPTLLTMSAATAPPSAPGSTSARSTATPTWTRPARRT
jgi:hypothetical protein